MNTSVKSNLGSAILAPRIAAEYGRGRRFARRASGALFGAVLGLGVGAANAAAPTGLHTGNAFGTIGYVKAGDVIAGLGTTGFLGCPCLGTNGVKISNDVTSISAGQNGAVLKTGIVLSTIQTTLTANSTTDEITNRVNGLNLLNGLVTADAIIATARTVATATEVVSDDVGSSFVNLKVAGQTVPVDVPVNTVINLPGLGTATLRQRAGVVGPNPRVATIGVNMIAINISQSNSYNLPIGAKIIIGHASSGFQRSVPERIYSGAAFATYAVTSVPGVLSNLTGMTALQAIGCVGTNGQTQVSNTPTLALNGIVSIGTGRTTIFAGGGAAKTTASVTQVSLLGGLISASGLNAVARTSIVNGKKFRSTIGSSFAGLRVLGLPVPVTVAPNTRINLPGIGFVTINGQTIPPATSEAPTVVTALQVFVTQANLLNLPVGASIVIGRASAGVGAPNPGS